MVMIIIMIRNFNCNFLGRGYYFLRSYQVFRSTVEPILLRSVIFLNENPIGKKTRNIMVKISDLYAKLIKYELQQHKFQLLPL